MNSKAWADLEMFYFEELSNMNNLESLDFCQNSKCLIFWSMVEFFEPSRPVGTFIKKFGFLKFSTLWLSNII